MVMCQLSRSLQVVTACKLTETKWTVESGARGEETTPAARQRAPFSEAGGNNTLATFVFKRTKFCSK